MTTQATANYAFQNTQRKKPAMNEENRCVQKAVTFAVSFFFCDFNIILIDFQPRQRLLA